MKIMQKLLAKKNSKKGFTLVELIVVLVILAILAAILIPTLTGYIDKAKDKAVIAEARMVLMASKSLVGEAYGKTPFELPVDATTQLDTLAELAKDQKVAPFYTVVADKKSGEITTFKYTNSGKTVDMTKGVLVVTIKDPVEATARSFALSA